MKKSLVFCRCCGRRIRKHEESAKPLWCTDCRGHIIDDEGLTIGERTYEGQHYVACPFVPSAADSPAEFAQAGDGA